MSAAAKTAASLANIGNSVPGSHGIEINVPSNKTNYNLYPMIIPWEKAKIETRINILKQIGYRLITADSRIKKTMLQFHDGLSYILIITSEGLKRTDLQQRTNLHVSIVAKQNNRKENNFCDISARKGLEFYSTKLLESLVNKIVTRTILSFEAYPITARVIPCVLTTGSAGILLHEAIGHGLETDFNRHHTYTERIGQKIANKQVTIIDSGMIPYAHGSINFDDEGINSQKTILAEQGILRSYLHDLLNARRYKTKTTSNGHRQSYKYAPLPHMSVTYMENGPHKPKEIIASVKNGLYAEQFSNGQVNIGAGDFSFYVKNDWAIKNGQLIHPAKDINVIGNGPQALSRITMVADDLKLASASYMYNKIGQTIPVSHRVPTTLISSINIGGS